MDSNKHNPKYVVYSKSSATVAISSDFYLNNGGAGMLINGIFRDGCPKNSGIC